jgi:predicted phosphodiesterase
MRFALISDIHANLDALTAVFDDIDSQHIDEVICLGDIVGYGPNPSECVSLIKDRCPMVILGNHDAAALGTLSTQGFNIHARIAIEWTTEHLTPDARSFLSILPMKETRLSLTFAHSTPYEPEMWHYITSLEEAAYNFQFFDTQFCFVGHTHIPLILVVNEKKELYVHQEPILKFGSLKDASFLINVGSVGQPRDRDTRACYGIFDSEAETFSYRRVKYDIIHCQAAMREANLPDFLISRLAEGK